MPATIDTGTTPAVTLAANNTAVTVTLAKSLTFTVDTTAFELDMDPSLPALADQIATVGLTVQTNANSGYTLAVADNATGLQSSGTGNPVIAEGVDRQGDVGHVARRAELGLHRDGHGRHDRRGVLRLEVRGLHVRRRDDRDARRLDGRRRPTRSRSRTASRSTTRSASGVYSDTVTYTVTPNYN